MATHSANTGSASVIGQRDGLPVAVVEDLLECPRRRHLLSCLIASTEPVAVDDLATSLANETESSQTALAADRQRTREEIYQDHLPKLTATGVVSFDSLLGTVEFTGPAALETRLDSISESSGEAD